MGTEKIKLTQDESMLLMAAKGHPIEGVTNELDEYGTPGYIKDVLDIRAYGTVQSKKRAPIFWIYLSLAERLLKPVELCDIIKKLWEDHFGLVPARAKWGAEERMIGYLLGKFAIREVADLEIDESWASALVRPEGARKRQLDAKPKNEVVNAR